MDIDWLKKQLERQGRGAKGKLARALELPDSAISKILGGSRTVSSKEADKIRAFFGAVQPAAELVILPSADVPVLGTALGGDSDGDFLLNGQPLHYVKRPAKFVGRDDLFALYVSGSSMQPRYFGGELIFCEARRAPVIGDHVVVEMHPTTDGIVPAYLKRLDAITPTMVKLTQYNPPKVLEIERKRIRQIVRVLTLADMIG
jgi:phage repressor protein C with HTH and peptisase S24 domain